MSLSSGLQLVALFGEHVEPLGGKVLLVEVSD